MFALSARPAISARPVAATRAVSARRVATAARRVVVRADPSKTPLEAAIEEAKDTCESGTSGECAVAWDTVRFYDLEREQEREREREGEGRARN